MASAFGAAKTEQNIAFRIYLFILYESFVVFVF